MTVEKWLPKSVVLAIHDMQLAEHGGAGGIRDEGLLDSALARPRNLAAHGDPDDFELAAATIAGLIRNHPFVDGNKRTAFLAGFVFLDQRGHEIDAPEAEVAQIILALAAGELDEPRLAAWLRDNTRPA